jgi:hypothetical protein
MQTQPTFELHEPAVIIATLWFVVLNPVIAFIIFAMMGWLMN